MNILVTGGTGFIGSHLLHRLVSSKDSIFLIKRKESGMWRINDIIDKITTLDVSSTDDLSKVFSGNKFDVIIHLATAYIKRSEGTEDDEKMKDVNITFPTMLLELAVKHNVKAFINTGTCFEYKFIKRPFKETDKLEPYNVYAATKIAFEKILQEYVKKNKINAITLKLFYPYGEKDNEKLITLLCRSLLTDKYLTITKGTQKINFTYVADIVDAYMCALSYVTSSNYKHYESFNIGSDKQTSIKEIVTILERISHKDGLISLTKLIPEDEILYMAADISKAKKIIGWYPKTNISDGLRRTYSYYLKNSV